MKFMEKAGQALSGSPLRAAGVEVLQVNVGYRCNMACRHCHIKAGPERGELMDRETVEAVLAALGGSDVRTLDITGGAPELNPHFRHLVKEAAGLGRHVMVRSNLTVFYEEGMGGLPELYAENGVEVIASLPYYLEDNVDRIRGNGTFQKSIDALRRLNELGYGGDTLRLSLVYNPGGAFLPPAQAEIEKDYKKELGERFGITFNGLYTFANMPIGRFMDFLVRTGGLEKYMEKLEGAFNPATLEGVMCRILVNVGWDGRLYDCDFNQVLGLPLTEGSPGHIRDFDYGRLAAREIAVAEHCYGCTAGQGST
jgi:radical SAM/Cys-rich protein